MSSHEIVPVEFAAVAAICTATEVVIGDRSVLGIADARALHRGLKVGREFAPWIKGRIAKYGFRQGVDYQVIDTVASPLGEASAKLDPPELANQAGGHGGDRRSLAYRLTLDMAKELAMVENNEAWGGLQ